MIAIVVIDICGNEIVTEARICDGNNWMSMIVCLGYPMCCVGTNCSVICVFTNCSVICVLNGDNFEIFPWCDGRLILSIGCVIVFIVRMSDDIDLDIMNGIANLFFVLVC
eukprot:1091224_1